MKHLHSSADFDDVIAWKGSGTKGLPQSEWLKEGLYPVIGQGASFIEGWSNREDLMIDAGDGIVLYGGHTRRSKHVTGQFVPGPNVKILKPCQALHSAYLHYFLAQAKIPDKGYADHFSEVRRLAIPIPPLDEQRRIAEILDKANSISSRQRDARNVINDLPRSIFLSIFGDPRSNPCSWRTFALSDIGRVVTGSTPPSSEPGMFEGEIPFVTPGDLGSEEASKRTLSEAGALRSRVVRQGSALVCCIGATIGKMDIARCDSAFNQQINAVEWGDSVLSEFGIEALRFFGKAIAIAGASTTLPILKKSSFEQLRIPVPPLDQQREYCRRLESIRPQVTNARRSLLLGSFLYQSLLARAFSGQLLP